MGEWNGTVIVRNRICRNFLKLCLIGQYVLLNSDVDGNNMNKSDAIDKEKIFKYTNDK